VEVKENCQVFTGHRIQWLSHR